MPVMLFHQTPRTLRLVRYRNDTYVGEPSMHIRLRHSPSLMPNGPASQSSEPGRKSTSGDGWRGRVDGSNRTSCRLISSSIATKALSGGRRSTCAYVGGRRVLTVSMKMRRERRDKRARGMESARTASGSGVRGHSGVASLSPVRGPRHAAAAPLARMARIRTSRRIDPDVMPNASAKLRANQVECERSELPRLARQLQRAFGDTAGILRARDDKKRSHLIFRECNNCRVPTAQCSFNISGGAIAKPGPKNLRRRASQETSLPEIVIFGDDQIAAIARMQPNLLVISRRQTHIANMRRSRVEIRETVRERWR